LELAAPASDALEEDRGRFGLQPSGGVEELDHFRARRAVLGAGAPPETLVQLVGDVADV
jgi:hypothetical protein